MPQRIGVLFSSLFVSLVVLILPVVGQDSPQQSDRNRDELLKKYDKNGDGKLDFIERMAMRRDRGKTRQPLPPADFANVSYGKHEHQKLDLWLAKSDKPTPLLIHFHGGGFAGPSGSRHTLNRELLTACIKAGISVATADYRVTEDATLPLPMHDAARAIQFLRFHAKKYNLDPRKVVAHGGSGGGGISLWLAYHDDLADPTSDDPVNRQSSRLTCAVVNGAQTSYDPRFIDKLFSGRDLWSDKDTIERLCRFYGLTEDETKTPKAYKLYEESAPINHVSADDPPVFMFYNRPDDPVTENTSREVWTHHPRFAEPLKTKANALNLEVVVKLAKDYPKDKPLAVTADMIAFCQRHFCVSPLR